MVEQLKKTILIDLDGVLNTYDGKYNEHYIPPIKDGAYEFIKELAYNYKVVLFTTRNTLLASKWIIENHLQDFIANVTNIKEPSFLIIDDRCVTFNGDYEELRQKIAAFQAWHSS